MISLPSLLSLTVFAVALYPLQVIAQSDGAEVTAEIPDSVTTSIDTGMRIALPLEIRGQVEFLPLEDLVKVHATPERTALVMYGEYSINANEIIYDTRAQTLTAVGNVRLWDRGKIYTGDRLIYELQAEKGTLFTPGNVDTGEKMYLSGDKLEVDRVDAAERWKGKWWRRPPEKEELVRYHVDNGTVTTCDLPVPHYQVDFKEIEVIPGDRFWIHDVWWNQGGWPMGYLPYFSRSLAKHRVAYIFSAGQFSQLGFGALNRINVHINPMLRGSLFADYFSDGGVGYGGNYRFIFPGEYGPRGRIDGYYLDQQDHDIKRFEDERYRWAGNYSQDLPWGWRITSEFHQRSDIEYSEDFDRLEISRGTTEYDLEKDTPSFVNIGRSWDLHTFRVTAAKHFDDFFFSRIPTIERLPEVRWDLMPMQIADSGAYVDAHLEYGDLRREQGFDQRTNFIDETERFDGELQLLYPVKLPWAINMTPFVGYRGTGYIDPRRRADVDAIPGLDEENFDDITRNIGEAGVTFSTRFTHTWDSSRDSSGRGAGLFPQFDKYRLVFQPQVSYGYYHPDEALEEITEGGQRFPYIDSTDDIRATMHRVDTRINTTLQAKQVGMSRTLARYGLGFGYDFFPDDNLVFESFDFAEDLADNSDQRATDFYQELGIYPADWLTLGHFMRYDIDDSTIRSSNTFMRFSYWSPWSTTIGYTTYDDEFIADDEQEEAYWNLLLRLSHKWSVMYHTRFDLDDSDLRKQRITFIRDLHDFIAFLELEHKNRMDRDDEYSVMFNLRFKGLGSYLPLY